MSRIVRCPGTLFTWIQPLALAAVASLKSSRIAIRSLLLTAMTFAAVAPSTGTSAELISRNALFPAPAASAPKLNDLNGDGKSDLVMRNANGIIAVFQMNGATVEMQNVLPPSEHRELRLAGDFDQDGKIDLVSLGGSPGTTVLSLMEGTMVRESQIVYAGVGAYAAHPVAVGDLNGDGFADIVFESSALGTFAYLMNGTTVIGVIELAFPARAGWPNNPASVHVTHAADTNGDGIADVVWRDAASGRIFVTQLDESGSIAASYEIAVSDSSWLVDHVADFNSDGKADLLLVHVGDGRTVMHLMNGVVPTRGVTILAANSGWSVTHVGDFNGDGRADLLMHHAQGRTYMKLMNGTAVLDSFHVSHNGAGWSVATIGDFNGDGRMDIVFRNVNGATDIWLMNGYTPLVKSTLFPVGSGWTPVLVP